MIKKIEKIVHEYILSIDKIFNWQIYNYDLK